MLQMMIDGKFVFRRRVEFDFDLAQCCKAHVQGTLDNNRTHLCLGLAEQMLSFSITLELARMQGSDRQVFAIETRNEMWA